jgi:hypothetical protein
MPIKKSRRTGWGIILAIILLGVGERLLAGKLGYFPHPARHDREPSTPSCGRLGTWGFAYSERPSPEESVHLPFGHRAIFREGSQRQPFASLDEVAQAVNLQMTGHPWRMSLTYLGAMRYSVSFSRRTRQGTRRLGSLVYAVVAEKVRREKGAGLQRVQLPPGNWFAPPGR